MVPLPSWEHWGSGVPDTGDRALCNKRSGWGEERKGGGSKWGSCKGQRGRGWGAG